MAKGVPVVLVHGYLFTSRKMRSLARHLEERGWRTLSLDLIPCCGQVPLETLADQLQNFLNDKLPPGEPVHLIGFSMGGLVCRYYLQRMGGFTRTRTLITIASPHHGTLLARLSRQPGCIQMRPGSDFLKDLNHDTKTLEQVRFASIWTPMDLAIVPPKSSRLPVGKECVLNIIAHPLMVMQPSALRAVAELLEE